jgi:hypothetical protein
MEGGGVTASVDIKLNESQDIYTESAVIGTIAYCIRVEVLYTVDGAEEVMNYFEKPVAATLDLAAAFVVADLDANESAETLQGVAVTTAYTITGSQCTSTGNTNAAPATQG